MSIIKKQKKIIEPSVLSVSEFKSWISGVEDMQDANWYPSPEQWNKIRAKISILSESDHQVSNNDRFYSPNMQTPVDRSVFAPTYPITQYVSTTSTPVLPVPPVPLYSEIDIKKQNDEAEYVPAFM